MAPAGAPLLVRDAPARAQQVPRGQKAAVGLAVCGRSSTPSSHSSSPLAELPATLMEVPPSSTAALRQCIAGRATLVGWATAGCRALCINHPACWRHRLYPPANQVLSWLALTAPKQLYPGLDTAPIVHQCTAPGRDARRVKRSPLSAPPRQPPLSAWSTREAAVLPVSVSVRVPPPLQAVCLPLEWLAACVCPAQHVSAWPAENAHDGTQQVCEKAAQTSDRRAYQVSAALPGSSLSKGMPALASGVSIRYCKGQGMSAELNFRRQSASSKRLPCCKSRRISNPKRHRCTAREGCGADRRCGK